MTKSKARDLEPGAQLLIKGKAWTVVKAKTKGKAVRLTVKGQGGEFTREVAAGDKFQILEAAPKTERWYEPGNDSTRQVGDPDQRVYKRAKIKPPKRPDVEAGARELAAEPRKAERKIVKYLDAILAGVQVEGQDYIVPEVDATTIAAHLLTFHALRFDGVPISEAKALLPEHAERTISQAEAMQAADWARAEQIHNEQHAQFEAGKLLLAVPHWHTTKGKAAA